MLVRVTAAARTIYQFVTFIAAALKLYVCTPFPKGISSFLGIGNPHMIDTHQLLFQSMMPSTKSLIFFSSGSFKLCEAASMLSAIIKTAVSREKGSGP